MRKPLNKLYKTKEGRKNEESDDLFTMSDEDMGDVDSELYDEEESFDDMEESFEDDMIDDNFGEDE